MVSQEQRRRQLAREKFLRQQQRRAAARRRARVRNSVIASVLGVVVIGSLALYTTGVLKNGDDDKANASAEITPEAAATSKAPDPCDKPAPGSVKQLSWKEEPEMTIDTSADYTLKLATTCGEIDVALKAKAAPHTVNSFDFLAGKGYFDHTKCHRLTTSGIYVLQCGDPSGTGTGGPGYTLPDENLEDSSLKGNVYPAGTVAMANTGQKHTGGSQFFLVYQDSPLPPSYTPFGTVSEAGMKVLKKIADAGENTGAGDGAPNATVVIDKATVVKS
ncbi:MULTISPECIES: peptidylprolyl isomerase [Streptomyces]|uniref:Peptidylprolyl isomerase n=1 Tax=Streptomyces thermoviolaceus subsp. thermoviolaceus TaxID=66860 RepID=A0ABX0YPD6_STRTL|nr:MULTISPECIES: peptidylprolyl isomerase [Streptomyces]MCM3263920.1 peptidylprolyl isomerase [Streptomyces thermoviolaceus]NJP12815.1 peptidylprolyl isomerase [Streptomyces thermoviolaceus subsp. thermoviolaceus]RSS08848.1 peptidylprolyl isomerase [Streptomyces sp. WAC00469]WTD50011.1 peptidylprolyl isomerase [Streptomyces thermoviolaceus]GGV68250.1 peptidyl-prolyl cis-trans isomerase [Streptomyces thermoviolaceus subsp. apingens]